jgi:hypothetical protein
MLRWGNPLAIARGTLRYGLVLPWIRNGLREFQWSSLKFACRGIQWDSLNAAELPRVSK